MNELLRISGLTVELPTAAGWVRPVNEVALRIGAGECVGLVGESGSGKTMLSLALMGLLPVGARVGGEVWLRGSEEGGASSSPTKGAGSSAHAAGARARDCGDFSGADDFAESGDAHWGAD